MLAKEIARLKLLEQAAQHGLKLQKILLIADHLIPCLHLLQSKTPRVLEAWQLALLVDYSDQLPENLQKNSLVFSRQVNR